MQSRGRSRVALVEMGRDVTGMPPFYLVAGELSSVGRNGTWTQKGVESYKHDQR